ncbi:MAG TPA: hypothetical protein H9846_00030 [Candidatus Gemmiger excrementipullorum]|uniref:Uncharacterized protein n=1 Tax=Candidatus Gemmiger excrementipullorum TaxID=2838610 RepID=A0A9D1XYT7_9FIRM|nr:hypothetical protein [Candidatus Gemmiger excrementipullorum]
MIVFIIAQIPKRNSRKMEFLQDFTKKGGAKVYRPPSRLAVTLLGAKKAPGTGLTPAPGGVGGKGTRTFPPGL